MAAMASLLKANSLVVHRDLKPSLLPLKCMRNPTQISLPSSSMMIKNSSRSSRGSAPLRVQCVMNNNNSNNKKNCFKEKKQEEEEEKKPKKQISYRILFRILVKAMLKFLETPVVAAILVKVLLLEKYYPSSQTQIFFGVMLAYDLCHAIWTFCSQYYGREEGKGDGYIRFSFGPVLGSIAFLLSCGLCLVFGLEKKGSENAYSQTKFEFMKMMFMMVFVFGSWLLPMPPSWTMGSTSTILTDEQKIKKQEEERKRKQSNPFRRFGKGMLKVLETPVVGAVLVKILLGNYPALASSQTPIFFGVMLAYDLCKAIWAFCPQYLGRGRGGDHCIRFSLGPVLGSIVFLLCGLCVVFGGLRSPSSQGSEINNTINIGFMAMMFMLVFGLESWVKPTLPWTMAVLTDEQKSTEFQKLLYDHLKLHEKLIVHKKKLSILKSQTNNVDKFILDMQDSLGKYHSSSVATTENDNPIHPGENTNAQILQQEKSAAAGVLGQLKTHHGTQESDLALTKDVLGIVATLGKVDDDNLSRLFAEYLGLDTMMAIVCKTFEGAKSLETYCKEGNISTSAGLHGLGPSIGSHIDGRFLVICLEGLRPFAGDFVAEDPQRRLALQKPRLPSGECPPGFLGFAVNMINLDKLNLYYVTPSGNGLRETLFYNLFSRLQVYRTKAEMQLALPCIRDGAVSLDGGMIRSAGVFSLGNRKDVEVRFAITSETPNPPVDYENVKEKIKIMKSDKKRLLEDMQREQTLLNDAKHNWKSKWQEFNSFLEKLARS